MSAANRSSFIYVTYIRTTSRKLWKALTDPELMRQYWFDMSMQSSWKKGSPWKLVHSDGATDSAGEVLEIDPPRRMVIRWQHERPTLKKDGPSRCTIEIEKAGKAVKLTVTHEINLPRSKLITAVSGGWPLVLSNLKSLLETGEAAITKR
jgi:uncharacterized protein YndB with AHSA1/START domain